MFLEHMNTELVDACRLTSARNTTNAHADTVAAIWQAAVDNLLRLRLMVGIDTLNKSDSLTQYGNIALDDAFHHLGNRKLATAETATIQVGIDNALACNAAIDL